MFGPLVEQAKLMEMSIFPAHGVLDGDVEIPERVRLRDVDPAPDERARPTQHDQKLVHEFRRA